MYVVSGSRARNRRGTQVTFCQYRYLESSQSFYQVRPLHLTHRTTTQLFSFQVQYLVQSSYLVLSAPYQLIHQTTSIPTMASYKDDYKKEPEPDILISDAIPADGPPPQPNGPPVPPGHNRFYCEKCRTPYDLPQNATSWRCARCSTFNSITPAECPWCTIL